MEKSSAQDGQTFDVEQMGVPSSNLKTAADGRTILLPQPSNDPRDPLNWPSWKKRMVLLSISWVALLPDFCTAMGSVTQIPQSKQWHIPVAKIQDSVAINLLLSGISSLFIVAASDFFGRAPILFWTHVVMLGISVWYAEAQIFTSFLGARIMTGLFVGTGQSGGLMWIKDMFFFHELPRKINIWSGHIIISPYLGPFMASFVVWGLSWHWVYWIYAIMNYVTFIIIVLVVDETFYDRGLQFEEQPVWQSRLLRLVGLERHGRYSPLSALSRPLVAISKIPVALITIYYFLNFSWTIGVNATIATWLSESYHFNGKETGLFYFAPIVGCILGSIAGHFLHDWFGALYMARHGGRIDPEARLYITYGASFLAGAAILILGQALAHKWHYMAVAMLDALQVIGVNIISTAVNAYLLDAYPEASGEVDAWIVVGRTMGGFMATYIDIPWVLRSGASKALGVQAAITWAAPVIVVFLQIFGKRLRQLQGPMQFPGETNALQ